MVTIDHYTLGGLKATQIPAAIEEEATRVRAIGCPLPQENEIYIDPKATEVGLAVDPAFKVKVLESIGRGLASSFATDSSYIDLTSLVGRKITAKALRLPIARWAYEFFLLSDLWSTRRSNLAILGAFCFSFSFSFIVTFEFLLILSSYMCPGVVVKSFVSDNCSGLSEDLLTITQISLVTISIAIEDTKSFQVRVSSFEVLTNLLQIPSLQKHLSGNAKTEIESFFSSVSHDKKPEVIEQASKALKFWTLLNMNIGREF